ncbi:MAG: S-methyl-5'-thioadenosine phosphorylase [Thermomicrobiales bacterium]|nr:MAG: S-methyl-5'-thioadenosine phosphorylase [Thermomicrobiales bacterium]
MSTMKLGVIGGSGLYDFPGLEIVERVEVVTPFGLPSAPLTIGQLGVTTIVFLPRHGEGHRLTPTELPYQANIYALKQLGVTHLVTVSAVGSLKESLPPLTIVIPDQIIDRTVARPRSFFGDGIVAHVGIADPFCPRLTTALLDAAGSAGIPVVQGGTYVCIEGPQFSTRAESNLYRSWDASVIGMTAMPEARLAREAEMCYATIAMVTDYDVWHETESAVTVEMVIANLHRNTAMARDMIRALALSGLPERTCPCGNALQNAIVTSPGAITPEIRRRLGVIGARYLAPTE